MNQTVYAESEIEALFNANIDEAIRLLSTLQIYSGRPPTFTGLRGWVYEQTIHYCITQEMQRLKIKVEINEQVPLRSRVKTDLTIGKAAVEVKRTGLFDSVSPAKYGLYAKSAMEKGFTYLFLTRQESYKPYRLAVQREVGPQNAFFLDSGGEWKRFIERLVELL